MVAVILEVRLPGGGIHRRFRLDCMMIEYKSKPRLRNFNARCQIYVYMMYSNRVRIEPIDSVC